MHIQQTGSVLAVAVLCVVPLSLPVCIAADGGRSCGFEDAGDLAGWRVEGNVSIDPGRDRGQGGGSLRVGPGGRAVWKLRDTNGSGVVEFWVYEDGAAPAKPKTRQTGPYYGVVQSDGRVLAPGSLYAPYLSGDTTYAITAFNPSDKEQSFYAVQYLGIKRSPGWHKWTFVFDPAAGVSVLHNDKDVNAARERFKWYTTRVEGFTGVVVAGDATTDANQSVWIDDVKVSLGGPMAVTPGQLAPPPPPPATPEKDPVPDEPARIVERLRGVHPRLLFTAADLPALRENLTTDYGKGLFERMTAYLPACVTPDHTRFLTDATDGQRQGFWRLPTVALHYVLTGDRQSFERAREFAGFLVGLEHWETGAEQDCGMSSANIMVGAALAYDWLYHDLEPDFRQAYRDKLLLMARRQYHQGHLKKLKGPHYWQGDPANNHRFHRDAGLLLAILAAAEEDRTDDDWLLTRALEEMRYVVNWLPEDGSCHESPTYAVFGNTHLTLAADAAQRCFGEPFLAHPFFRNAPSFRIHSMLPNLTGVFPYGDSGGGGSGYNSFLHRMCAHHRLADEQAAIAEIDLRNETFFNFTWYSVIWWRPLPGGSLDRLPRQALFPDVGIATFRTGWQASDVGAMFKCGPMGGYTLNAYRRRENMKYVNVAHDDPDANSFVIFVDGNLLAESDRYSKHKRSANHNTILINGAGQVTAGRPEGAVWSQPGGNMAAMGVITALGRNGDTTAVEGEAAGSYLADPRGGPKRPALERFRRIFVWVEGGYILVVDDIRGPAPVEVTWLMQGPELTALDANDGRYVLRKDDAVCPFQVAATETMNRDIVASPADNRGKPLGWQQLRLTATTSAIRVAGVFDPWRKGDLRVALEADAPDHAVITVSGSGMAHSWDWTAGAGRFGPSRLVGTDAAGTEIVAMTQPEPHTRRLLAEADPDTE